MTNTLEIKLLSENATMPKRANLRIVDWIYMYQKQSQSQHIQQQ